MTPEGRQREQQIEDDFIERMNPVQTEEFMNWLWHKMEAVKNG
jgi:hypothetical protein